MGSTNVAAPELNTTGGQQLTSQDIANALGASSPNQIGTTLVGEGQLPQTSYQAQALGNTGNQNGGLALNNYSPAVLQALGNYNQAYGNQNLLAGQLQQQALGYGPAAALAQQQMMQNLQQTQASVAGSIAANRGINPAQAINTAANAQAAQSQQEAGQAAQERLQSQLGATQALGGVLGQQQSGNLGLLGGTAGAQNAQNSLLNQQNLGVAGINSGTANQNTSIAQQGQNLAENASSQNAANNTKLVGGGVGAGGAALATLFADGGPIPGGHGPHPGDDKRNDTIPVDVQKGEVVLPASIADDPKAAKAFIEAINKKHKIQPNMSEAMNELALLSAKVEALQAKFGIKGKK